MRNTLLRLLAACGLAAVLSDPSVLIVRTAAADTGNRGNGSEIRVASPDKNVEFTLSVGEAELSFTVARGGLAVIDPSPITASVDAVEITRGVVQAGGVERYQIDETYAWRGVRSRAVNRCSGARIPLVHRPSEIRYVLDVRAFNDGVAFRHVVPGEGGRVPGEATVFVVPAGSTVWYHDLEGHYEA
ncbi:MAG TPA: glycoside hydrolase family 97 N-terminal domain-containing protein, partial [Planctomycetaceae bacterium]|nr:glycoside hydrolase family 97 N-terminal domain-containing protein [Planctomycetaceae bacterium]